MLEKEIEDWVCESIEEVCGQGAVVLGRQVKLPSGRVLDVLARHCHWPSNVDLAVVEVKKDRAGVAALVQLQDYMNEIAGMSGGVRGILVAPSFDESVVRSAPQGREYMVDLVVCRTRVEFLHQGPVDHMTIAYEKHGVLPFHSPFADLLRSAMPDILSERDKLEREADDRRRKREAEARTTEGEG